MHISADEKYGTYVIADNGQQFEIDGIGSIEYHIVNRRRIIEKQKKQLKDMQTDLLISEKRLAELLSMKEQYDRGV